MLELKDTIEGMISDDYKERFIAEYNQVRIRVAKLESMITKYYKKELDFQPTTPIDVLVRQKIFMFRYMKILELRATYEGIDLD
jgi:hypothetical protein